MSDKGMKVHNIVLIGFMGCGKSTIGREIKRALGFQLIDTDAEIEARAGCRIPAIFAAEGEHGFRERESALREELRAKDLQGTVVSTGGGAILRAKNRDTLRQIGYVVWLRANADTIYQRTKNSRSRPILQTADPRQVIEELLTQRTPLYRDCAHLVIDVGGLNRAEIVTGIVESARYFYSQF